MGKPAVRVGDMTSHGTPLNSSPGSNNVLIGGKPAWRCAMDFHSCVLQNPGPSPHVGGVVSIGSSTVLINGLSAVRVGDQITESGPPNTITSGEISVLIG